MINIMYQEFDNIILLPFELRDGGAEVTSS